MRFPRIRIRSRRSVSTVTDVHRCVPSPRTIRDRPNMAVSGNRRASWRSSSSATKRILRCGKLHFRVRGAAGMEQRTAGTENPGITRRGELLRANRFASKESVTNSSSPAGLVLSRPPGVPCMGENVSTRAAHGQWDSRDSRASAPPIGTWSNVRPMFAPDAPSRALLNELSISPVILPGSGE